jgi:hypothetical protein
MFAYDVAVCVPFETVLKWMGLTSKTQMPADERAQLERLYRESFAYIKVDAVALRLPIEALDAAGMTISGGVRFESTYVHKWFDGCREVLLMGSTAGAQIMQRVCEDADRGELRRALVYGTVGGAAADAGLDHMQQTYRRLLAREGREMTRDRWSAGFADFSLSHQRLFCELLGMSDLGVEVLPSAMLRPEKSVTAFCGIK